MSTIYESQPLTDGNLRNNHIYISPFRDRLPRDVIGGSTKDSPAPRLIRLEHGGETVDTYIPTTQKGVVRSFFQARSFVRSFFDRSGAEIGDIVLFEEVSPYHLRTSLAQKASSTGSVPRRIATPEEYARYFDTELSDKEQQALQSHVIRGEISMGDLAALVGYESYEPMNRLYGGLGHRISDQ